MTTKAEFDRDEYVLAKDDQPETCPHCGAGPLVLHFPCEAIAACPRCTYCRECGDLIDQRVAMEETRRAGRVR